MKLVFEPDEAVEQVSTQSLGSPIEETKVHHGNPQRDPSRSKISQVEDGKVEDERWFS